MVILCGQKKVEKIQQQKELTQINMTEQANPQEQRIHSLLLHADGSESIPIVKNMNKKLQNKLPSIFKHILHLPVKN